MLCDKNRRKRCNKYIEERIKPTKQNQNIKKTFGKNYDSNTY